LDTIHQKEGSFFYDIQQGEQHNDFLSFLLKEAEEKIRRIEKTENYRQARNLLTEFKKGIKNEKAREKLEETKTPRLVHGDMIIHNLLTDSERLSGVIDWELARWSDHDHDIVRLMYYQECARSYYHQGKDDSFEYDFLNKLLTFLEDKINREDFELKYIFYRSLFYLGALAWAVNSNSPEENIKELEDDWKKIKADTMSACFLMFSSTATYLQCIPLEKQPSLNTGKCIYCGKEANYRPVWARNY
jgi:thiamine kinase-like enzyme